MLGLRVSKKASVYESAPVDCEDDAPSFYNTVIEVRTTCSPRRMLELTQSVEVRMGRPKKHGHHAPRTVDLDILYLGRFTMHSEQLILPHPRITERRFVLEPLREICPDLVLPDQEKTVAEMLDALESSEPPLKLITNKW